MKLLVVEDEPILLEVIGKKLEKERIQVLLADSAKKGFEFLINEKEAPDAIWLDYYLKDFTGLDFVIELKKNHKWANIPIIVVSNSASTEKVNSMLALGVNKYLLKANFRLEDIIKEVSNLIKTNEQNTCR
jgi:DNA-binding response OmpR family regulator